MHARLCVCVPIHLECVTIIYVHFRIFAQGHYFHYFESEFAAYTSNIHLYIQHTTIMFLAGCESIRRQYERLD